MKANRVAKSLFDPENNFNHKVIQRKKHKLDDKRTKKDVEEFLRTQGDDDEQQKEAD